jgi:hypothetical protein
MAIKHTKSLQCIPKGYILNEHFSSQDPPKYTSIGIFGMKICHLAALLKKGFLGVTFFNRLRLLQIRLYSCPTAAGTRER